WDAVVVDGSIDPELPGGAGAMLKRVVGLPGEALFIAHGDVYVAGGGEADGHGADGGDGEEAGRDGGGAARARLLRKPDELIAALLVPMQDGQGLQPPWTWVGPGTRDDLPDGSTRLTAAEPSAGSAVYQSFIDDGLPGQPGDVPVSDTALQVVVGACDG